MTVLDLNIATSVTHRCVVSLEISASDLYFSNVCMWALYEWHSEVDDSTLPCMMTSICENRDYKNKFTGETSSSAAILVPFSCLPFKFHIHLIPQVKLFHAIYRKFLTSVATFPFWRSQHRSEWVVCQIRQFWRYTFHEELLVDLYFLLYLSLCIFTLPRKTLFLRCCDFFL